MAKLAAKSKDVLDYLKANDTGDGVAISEIAAALNAAENQVRPCVTLTLGKEPKDGSRGVLATYEKRKVDGEDKEVGYAVLTDEGRAYVDPEE